MRYSRYADDITFSTNQKDFPVALAVQDSADLSVWTLGDDLVQQIGRAGFKINDDKTRMHCRGSRQMVTGLVVNEKVNIRSEYYRKTLKQPVHGGVKIVLVDLPERQRLGQRVARGVRRQAPGGRQLGTRIENAGDDHRQHASALGRVRAGDRTVQAQFAQRPEHGGDMAVRKGALDVEGVLAPDQGLVSQHPPQGVDFLRGPLGEVGQGAFLDFAVFAPALAQENSGRRVSVGDRFDIHGNDDSS